MNCNNRNTVFHNKEFNIDHAIRILFLKLLNSTKKKYKWEITSVKEQWTRLDNIQWQKLKGYSLIAFCM